MIPKEKAKELVNKFYFKLSNNGSLSMGLNSCDARHKESIQCALIAIEETLDATYQINNVYYYYLDVKKEIEKL